MFLQLIPSVYAQEMSQSTEERLANTCEMHPPRILELLDMSETTHQKVAYLALKVINISKVEFTNEMSDLVCLYFPQLNRIIQVYVK